MPLDLWSTVVMWATTATAWTTVSMVAMNSFALDLVDDRAVGDSVRSAIRTVNWKSLPMRKYCLANCWNYCNRSCHLLGPATRDGLAFAPP